MAEERELVVLVTRGTDHELSSVAFTIANGGITAGLNRPTLRPPVRVSPCMRSVVDTANAARASLRTTGEGSIFAVHASAVSTYTAMCAPAQQEDTHGHPRRDQRRHACLLER